MCCLAGVLCFCVDVACGVSFGFAGQCYSAERLCEDELCCLGYRRKICALSLLYEIYHRADHPLHAYIHHFVAIRSTRASAVIVISRCRTDQFSRPFLPAAVCLWNLLQSVIFSDGILSSFKSAINLCLLSA